MEPLDPQVLNLTKAIKRAETGSEPGAYNRVGDKGTSRGAYQFQDSTWKDWSKKHLKVDNAPMTVENQNRVAYSQIKEWKDAGLSPAQVASKWNSGRENAYLAQDGTAKGHNTKLGVNYDVPAYVAKVSQYYKELDELGKAEAPTVPETRASQSAGYKPLFTANAGDGAVKSGLKALGNTIPSAYNFGKGVLQSLNPINTLKNLAQIPDAYQEAKGANDGSGAKTIGRTLGALPREAYKATVPQGVRQLVSGDLAGATKTFTEDPFGTAAPLVFAATGGAKVADNLASRSAMKSYVANIGENTRAGVPIPKKSTKYTDIVDNTISTVGKAGAKPLSTLVSGPVSLASKVTRSAASQLVGLEPESISQILSNPKEYSKIVQERTTRGNLANEFGRAVEAVEDTLAETGKAYEPIRKSTEVVSVPPKFIDSVLSEFGFKVNKGKVQATSDSITRNTSDVNALQNFYNNWGSKKQLSPNEYLNMRKDIGGIAKFGKELGTNVDAQVVGTRLYERANQKLRPQVKGLRELDEQFSPQKEQFNQIKKDFLQKDTNGEYVFKDGAVNKIANAANKGKDSLLARIEEVMPGVTKQIQILRTVEDIQKAYGIKVGTYSRGVMGGIALTGNVPAIVASIIGNPSIAVPLLRSLGYTATKVRPILNTLKMIAGDVNNSKLPVAPMFGIQSVKPNNSVAENNPVGSGL